MTASAARYSGSAAEPMVSRQPVSVRASSRTIAFTRTSALDALATASGRAPSPVVSVTKTGFGAACAAFAGGGGMSEAAASVSVACRAAAAASGASVAPKESSSERPAYTPPSSGSTSRSTTSAPSRPPTYSVTDTSPVPGSRRGSRRARPIPSAETTPVAASSSMSAGTPMNCRRGSGCSLPPAVDRARGGARRDEVRREACCCYQLDALGPPGEQRLRALVHRHAGDLAGRQLPAQARRALKDGDPHGLVLEEEGRREPGDPAPDHDHVRRSACRHGSQPATAAKATSPG